MGDRNPPSTRIAGNVRRKRTLRLLVIALLLTVITILFILPLASGFVAGWFLVHPACGDTGTTPANFNIPYKDIRIASRRGGAFRGFYMPGNLEATIIVPPPLGSGRDALLAEATLLAADGFNVVTFEAAVCAGQSAVSLGYNEVEDIEDVIAYLRKNPDGLPVKLSKIALHGFSAAGAASTMAAARIPEIDALLTEGGYHSWTEISGLYVGSNWLENLLGFGGRLAYRISTGVDATQLDPIGAIAKVPPRPVFLVYGSKEASLAGARLQLAAIRDVNPNSIAELWVVPGANHGTYLDAVTPAEYSSKVIPFYRCALLNQCERWQALWKAAGSAQ